MPTIDQLQAARAIVYGAMEPTPQRRWPLLDSRLGREVWVKHENLTPLGAFKVRGGLVHMRLRKERGETNGVITASTGNHGQSIPYAARREGIAATVVVPVGNSPAKNAAMRALGAELIEHGHDFSAAREFAEDLAKERRLSMVPSFHDELVLGVSSYACELFEAAGDLDTVYVPIGMGSGICGVIAARDALGLKTEVVGVVAEGAEAYALSFAAREPVATNRVQTFAEGLAVRVPHPDAVAAINAGAARVVKVSDAEMAEAMRVLFGTTRTVAEGAGAAGLAALMGESCGSPGARVGVVLSGGNIDPARFATVLGGGIPAV
ncbi:MAG: threonine dehydratase [Hyphomicrobiales bacterium]